MTLRKTVRLGDNVRDKITGITGIAVAQTFWLHGCERITIQPPLDKDGKMQETQTFDAPQLEIIRPSKQKKAKPRHGNRENVGTRPNVG